MAQQERARRTRAAIVEAAAVEFAKRGYSAASVNTILEGSNATKGAMYFHFQSKEDLARAVLSEALDRYRMLMDQWALSPYEPFETMRVMVDDIARHFGNDVIVRAEFRLVIEPEFYADIQAGAAKFWGVTALQLAQKAQQLGMLRRDVDPAQFTRVLTASMAGQRYMADLTAGSDNLRALFSESYEMVLRAMAAPEWLEQWTRDGWQASSLDLAELAADQPV